MQLKLIIAVLQKELREVRRDRRTLFLTLVLPLFFYPAVLIISVLAKQSEFQTLEKNPPQIGIYGLPELQKKLAAAQFQIHELTEPPKKLNPRYDLAIHTKGKDITLFHASSTRGLQTKKQVQEQLDQWLNSKIKTSLTDAGIATSILTPYALEWIDTTPKRERIGQQFGIVGAYLILFLSFSACMAVAVDAGAGERERGTLESMLMTPASLFSIGIGKLLYVMSMGLLSCISTLIGLSSLFLLQRQVSHFLTSLLDPFFFIALAFILVGSIVFFSSTLYTISMRAKNLREAQLKASLVMMIVALSLIISGSSAVANSQWVWYVPILNAATGIKEVIMGVLVWKKLLIMSVSQLLISLAFLAWLSHQMKSEKGIV